MQSKSVAPEIIFAQQLASNFTNIRYKAFKKLQKWLAARSAGGKELSREEFLKIWKGLFYCMWMCDKPLPQEELAQAISNLIHSLATSKLSFLFIDTFFETMAREWNGIDCIRLDKFMMLVRRFLRESFSFLHKLKFNPKAIRRLMKILQKTVLHPVCDKTPEGLKLHFSDIYLQELARVGGNKITPKKSLIFLSPCCHFLSYAENPVLKKAFEKNIFTAIIELSVNEEESEEEGETEDVGEQEEEDDTSLKRFNFQGKILKANRHQLESCQDLPALPLKFESLAKLLIKHGSKDDIKQRNRDILYDIAKKFQDLASGVNPLEKNICEVDVPGLRKKEVAKAIKRELKEREKLAAESEEWRREKWKIKRPKICTEDLLEEEFLKTEFPEFSDGTDIHVKEKSEKQSESKKRKAKKEKGKIPKVKKCTAKAQTSVTKKVNFALTNNTAHGHVEYHKSVEGSPAIPFDASKKPSQGVLKASKLNKRQKTKIQTVSKKANLQKTTKSKNALQNLQKVSSKLRNLKLSKTKRMTARDFF